MPIIYARAVAVREDRQGNGLGTALVINAMKRCLDISKLMGAAAIVLDVLEGEEFDQGWKFEADVAFQPLGDTRRSATRLHSDGGRRKNIAQMTRPARRQSRPSAGESSNRGSLAKPVDPRV